MIVRKEGAEVELERGFGLVEVNRLGSSFEKGVDACRIEMLAGFVFEIGARFFNAIVNAGTSCGRVAGYPAPAAGARRGATEYRLLFGDDHGEISMRAAHRTCKAPGTRTDHQDIDFSAFQVTPLHDAR